MSATENKEGCFPSHLGQRIHIATPARWANWKPPEVFSLKPTGLTGLHLSTEGHKGICEQLGQGQGMNSHEQWEEFAVWKSFGPVGLFARGWPALPADPTLGESYSGALTQSEESRVEEEGEGSGSERAQDTALACGWEGDKGGPEAVPQRGPALAALCPSFC